MLKGAQLPFEHIYNGKSSTEIDFYIPILNEEVKVAHALNRIIAKKKKKKVLSFIAVSQSHTLTIISRSFSFILGLHQGC